MQTPGRRILIVDDEPLVREPIATWFLRRGYQVTTASSAAEALELLRNCPATAMIADIRMPGMSGIELVPRALALDPDLAVLMLTGVNDATAARETLAAGAIDYLTKPIDLAELEAAIERALHRRSLNLARGHVERTIREEVALRTRELEEEKQALRLLTLRVTAALVTAMEAKSENLRGHSLRVGELAGRIAATMQLPVDVIEQVHLAGQLHDVGMIGVRESVLDKEGPLTEAEIAHIHQHVQVGLDILDPLNLGPVATFVADHHEHYDGQGYPRGLAGDAISIGGRILAAADAYDALTSSRPGRAALATTEALRVLSGHAGTLLDPEIYFALVETIQSEQSHLRYVA